MNRINRDRREEIRWEIAATLGTDPNRLPALLTTEQVAKVLGVKPATLQNWRSLGRHNLPFVRVGRFRGTGPGTWPIGLPAARLERTDSNTLLKEYYHAKE